MDRKGCLVLVTGLPGSGKSNFSQQLVNHIRSNCLIRPFYISFDDLIPLNEQKNLIDQNYSSCKVNRRHFVSSCQVFLNYLTGSLSSQPNSSESHSEAKFVDVILQLNKLPELDYYEFCFIVEDNFYYKSMREEFFRLAKQSNIGLVVVMINTPINQCLLRNQKRCLPIEERIILRMNEVFEVPRQEEFGVENSDKVKLLTLDDKDSDRFELIITLIKEAIYNPLNHNQEEIQQLQVKRDVDRMVTAVNPVHKFDNILRQSIALLMINGNNDKPDGKQLAIIRKQLLKKFRESELETVEAFVFDQLEDDLMKTSEQDLIKIGYKLIQQELKKDKK